MTHEEQVATIHEALHYGLDYFGHELDDVGSPIAAVTSRAQKFERAIAEFDSLAAALDQAQQEIASLKQERMETVANWEREYLTLGVRAQQLEEALRSLEAEGWFAAWSDDPRVIAIRAALNPTPPDEA